jgi:hypothetical protein
VDAALTLDIGRLLREQVLVPGSRTSGTAYWTNEATGQPIAAVIYEANLTGDIAPSIRLSFAVPDTSTGQRREVEQLVPLVTTRPHFGGVRWWFVDGGERVRCLYLPSGVDRFRSRRAHGLVYASQYRHEAPRRRCLSPRLNGRDRTP